MTKTTMKAVSRVMLLAMMMGASACATVVGETTQEVLIETDPTGAECRVDREGANVAVVKQTPGRVNLSRSKVTMIVSCEREGHEQANEPLVSSFTGATFGNILLGGIIGIAVDAASGANNKYPDRVIIVMTPASFPDAAARDAHFSRVKDRLSESANAEIKQIKSRCNSSNAELCRIEEKKLTDARDKALADIDAKRQAAKIVPPRS